MRLKQGLKLRQVGKHYMIVDARGEEVNLASVFTLNGVAARLWQHAAEGEFTERELVELICRQYEVEPEQAAMDVKALVAQWREYGLTDE